MALNLGDSFGSSLSVGDCRIKSNNQTKYVELPVECLRTRVQFPPPPPIIEGQRLSVDLFSCLLPRVRGDSCGSTPLTGDEHSSDPVNYTIPSALSQDSHAVIFKISEPIRSARKHLHLRVESFGDAVRFGEAPHAHNRFEPR